MWFLASDHHVQPLGNLGMHEENEVLSLDHVALKKFDDLAVCGAFYSTCDAGPSPRNLPLRCSPDYDTPILDRAIERLQRAGVKVAQCPRHLCATQAELQARVTSALLTGSPVAFKAPYLRKEVTQVHTSIHSRVIT
jgi:hypothetical protein